MIDWAVAIGTWAVSAAMLLNLYRLAGVRIPPTASWHSTRSR